MLVLRTRGGRVAAVSVSLLVSSVLTVTLTQPAAGGTGQPIGVVPAAVTATPRTSLPPLPPSTPQDLAPDWADPRLVLPEAPVSAPPLAPPPAVEGEEPESAFDPDTSVVIERKQFSETYLNEDGSKTTALSDQPINVRSSTGAWVEADDTVRAAAGGTVVAPLHPLNPTFAPSADSGELLTVRSGDHWVRFALQGAAPSPAQRAPEAVSYADVLPGADLRFETTGATVKEMLVLESDPGAGAASWDWDISTSGLQPTPGKFGGVDFVDASGTVVMVIPRAGMWDSSGVEGVSEPAEAGVELTVTPRPGGWVLTQAADPAWLSDPARVYPVYVDPSAGVGPSNVVSYKSDGYVCESCTTRTGNSRSNGANTYYRTLVKYNYEQFFGRQITGARIHYVLEDGTLNRTGGLLHHATGFSYNGVGDTLSGFAMEGETLIQDVGLAQRLAVWNRTGAVGGYFMIRAGEDPGVYTYKSGRTALYVDWNDYPTAGTPANGAPANGATNVSLQPTLSASSAGTNGDALAYLFRVGTGPDVEATYKFHTPWNGSDRVAVPEGALQPNTTYYWRAYVHEPYWEQWLGTSTIRTAGVFSFRTHTPAPAPQQASAQPADGSVITSTTPTLSTATVTDPDNPAAPVQYKFTIATGQDGTSGAVLVSDWLGAPSWTPPAVVLRDGGTYTWSVQVKDAVDTTRPAWRNRLTVNQRIGESGPAPVDGAGPVSVNLANGGVSLGFSSPTVATVGGPMGLTFSYNSLRPVARGLTGEYFDARTALPGQTWDSFTGRTPVMVRTDPAIAYNWGMGTPAPAVPADQ